MTADSDNEKLLELGKAALVLWPRLPPDWQQALFEQVVTTSGEAARHDLATFLHNHHPRTFDATMQTRTVPTPDSLGG